jgi:8-oxo-dGTP pyrophosphatase MutT (NUDIX family)
MPIFHPQPDDQGKPVAIKYPSTPTEIEAWADPAAIATVVPDGRVPAELNGVALTPWADYPRTAEGWGYLDGINEDLDEPPIEASGMKPAAGAVILEPDGRVWVVHPTNQFGGYQATFPKGRVDTGQNLQAAAIRECLEEAGLQVRLTGWLGDFERTTTRARLYLAERVGGTPAAMGWESQAVSLVPLSKLGAMLNGAADKPVLERLMQVVATRPKLHPADGEVIRHGGNLVRTLQALDGFMATHGCWPTRLQIRPECLVDLATHHLTPLGFYRLQSKVQLEISDELDLIARDEAGRLFDYGLYGWDVKKTGLSAREWLGI